MKTYILKNIRERPTKYFRIETTLKKVNFSKSAGIYDRKCKQLLFYPSPHYLGQGKQLNLRSSNSTVLNISELFPYSIIFIILIYMAIN